MFFYYLTKDKDNGPSTTELQIRPMEARVVTDFTGTLPVLVFSGSV